MIRLAVRVRREQAEIVLAELLGLAPNGVEEVDVDADTVEYAVYGPPGELPGLPDLNAVVGEALVEISTTDIPDDWHERWREFHRPVLIVPPAPPGGDALTAVPAIRVRPPWEAASGADSGQVQEIVIDPGQAFGTGGHASTRLCLELLLELAAAASDRGPVLDVGTGSGVLAIAAARLGYAPIVGLDHEQESVEAAAQNAHVNRVELDVRRFDLRTEAIPAIGPAGSRPQLVLANLLRPLLLELAATMPGTPANLIAGGLLVEEADEIAGAFAARMGLHERDRRASGDWAALWLQAR